MQHQRRTDTRTHTHTLIRLPHSHHRTPTRAKSNLVAMSLTSVNVCVFVCVCISLIVCSGAKSSARELDSLLNKSKAYKDKQFTQQEQKTENTDHTCEAVPGAKMQRTKQVLFLACLFSFLNLVLFSTLAFGCSLMRAFWLLHANTKITLLHSPLSSCSSHQCSDHSRWTPSICIWVRACARVMCSSLCCRRGWCSYGLQLQRKCVFQPPILHSSARKTR